MNENKILLYHFYYEKKKIFILLFVNRDDDKRNKLIPCFMLRWPKYYYCVEGISTCSGTKIVNWKRDFMIWEVLLRKCTAWNMLSILRGSPINPHFFKFANLKRNFSYHPSAMFLASTSKMFMWGTSCRRVSLWTARRCWGYFYCFADPTWEGNFEAEYFGHAKGPWTRRNISVDSEKKCAGCKEIANCFV
jgi:hypothetical protein